ncbi:MAG: hypothetical protein EAZ55_05370 [Cytophagales bacterium]|nr:MAG: hypothetical protein EAZ55_05370 [Cytophagales bacterium]
MKKHIVFLLIFYISNLSSLLAQGCSDAGFCTMGAMRPNQYLDKRANLSIQSIEVAQSLGVVPVFQDMIHSTIIDINASYKTKTSFQARIPYNIVHGKLGTTQSIGDLFLSVTQIIVQQPKLRIALTIGTRLAIGQSNLTNSEGHVLPLYYQSGMGSNDIIVGASLMTNKWMFALGYQQSLNNSKNTFDPQKWQDSQYADIINNFAPNNQFRRGTDLMFRFERNYRFARFNGFVGALGIYRLNPDQVTMNDNEKMLVQNTQGIVVSAMAGIGYQFSAQSGIKLLVARKISNEWTRTAHIDGLARDWVFQIGYQHRFFTQKNK